MTTTTRYMSCAETAKLVRTALKEAFSGVTFSVKSRTYSGGASIDVEWTDGPTSKEVEAVAKQYEGATFDGMQDLKSYKSDVLLNGERVHYGADFIHCKRDYSADLLRECAEKVGERYGVPAPEVVESTYTSKGKTHTNAWIEFGGEPLDRYADGSVANYASTARDKVNELAYATSKYASTTTPTPEPTPAEATAQAVVEVVAPVEKKVRTSTVRSINKPTLERLLLDNLTMRPWQSDSPQETFIDGIREVQTYEDASILTRDNGIVIRMANGAEFQVTIVQSRTARVINPCGECGEELESDGSCGNPECVVNLDGEEVDDYAENISEFRIVDHRADYDRYR